MGVALTERERQIYLLVIAARSNKQMAAELGISVHTVRFHVANLLHKFHVSDRLTLLSSLLEG